ncbi:acyl-CoA carboxylase subunit beta [Pseudohalioglobus lutimaris]|uniref:Carboxyl transferase n=1 Tax=Pseudohalioglobus lutimaris TaxID=1737061 RepID=A0A2N5X304_9GAMM|nr:carboxyl transferase domain-containing protein [Pseudohalioglobus lutimaris]PLW68872.1 carboxyl transferase [Pseudohalioglobus lutimaris]
MSSNREQWQGLLAELDQRQAQAEAMGGEEKIARQHARGRLTARERLALLFDPGTLNEIGALAGANHPGGQVPLAGDGVVGGTGLINGRDAVALAEDFTVKGGSIGHANAAKRTRLVRLALEQRLPLVLLLDGAGERAGNSTERYPNTPNDLQLVADLQGKVPVVTLVLGTSAGHGALTGMFADFIIMLEGASLFTAGPPLVQAAMGITTTPEELGSAVMHATRSGVVHNLAGSEQEAFNLARDYLSYMPQRSGELSPVTNERAEAQPGDVDALLDIIPPTGNASYDMREVLQAIADDGGYIELQPGYGGSLICALARFGSVPTMVVANQPNVLAGAITVAAAEKAAHFIEIANAFGLPLLTLLDNPGVLPGPQSEQEGVLKAAGRMFAAQRRYRGRKIVVTLRKAFGFGSSVMGMNPWDRQAISIALPSVSLGGMPAIGGAEAAKASAEDAGRLQELQSGAWVPADAMAFDKVVNPAALRREIIAVLHRT